MRELRLNHPPALPVNRDTCPGCGDALAEVGALGMFTTRCCGSLPYALCTRCAAVMARGDEKQRADLMANIELGLAVDEGNPQ